MSPSNPQPSSRRSPLARLVPILTLGPVGRLVGHGARWVRGAPRWLQAILVLGVLAGGGLGGYYLFHKRAQKRQQEAAHAGWKRFDAAARKGDEAEMRAGLADVRAAAPGDELSAQRERALDTGEADPADPAMIRLTLVRHLRAGRWVDAAREADKYLAHEPNDWLARCTKAGHALHAGDRPAADRILAELPQATDRNVRVEASGLLLAYRLFVATGRDVAPLRAVVQTYVLPFLRTPAAEGLSPAGRADLVECYLNGFDPDPTRPQPPAVVQGWAAAARLADSAAADALEAKDSAALVRVGRLSARLDAGLRAFRRHGQVTDEQFADYRRELEDRTRRAWGAVRDQDPKNPEAYRGLADSHLRDGGTENLVKAFDTIVQGLVACGDSPELAELYSLLLRRIGRADLAYHDLVAAAGRNPGQPVWWQLAAEAATAAHRRDWALDAVGKLLAAVPGHRGAIRFQAGLYLEAGDASKAAQLLAGLGEPTLARDPLAARAYTRALTEAGLEVRVEDFIEAAVAAGRELNTPLPAVAAVRGWADAPPTATRAEAIAARADRLLERWSDLPALLALRAEALARLAELGEPAWDPVKVGAAVQAWNRVRAIDPDGRPVAVALARLRLSGENNPEQAARDAAPLLAAEADPTLTPADLELIGAVYRTTGKLDDAARVLERAAGGSNPTAGCWTQLALTYHAQGKRAEAQAAVHRARGMPRTPREQADYVAAAKTILQ